MTRLRTPLGVAWPTVSQTQTRPAPARIAVVYIRRMWSGCARVVSSVTYITGSPSRTASDTASSDRRSIRSKSQSSVYCRMGDEPMKQETSIGMPTFWEISMIGRMSAATVRAAQLGRIFIFDRTISWASRVTVSTTWGPAPGRPMSAESIPSASIRCRIWIFCSIDGLLTEGDCRPSRSVSSSISTVPREGRPRLRLGSSRRSGRSPEGAKAFSSAQKSSRLPKERPRVAVTRRATGTLPRGGARALPSG